MKSDVTQRSLFLLKAKERLSSFTDDLLGNGVQHQCRV